MTGWASYNLNEHSWLSLIVHFSLHYFCNYQDTKLQLSIFSLEK